LSPRRHATVRRVLAVPMIPDHGRR
jgi:hypothetical protein